MGVFGMSPARRSVSEREEKQQPKSASGDPRGSRFRTGLSGVAAAHEVLTVVEQRPGRTDPDEVPGVLLDPQAVLLIWGSASHLGRLDALQFLGWTGYRATKPFRLVQDHLLASGKVAHDTLVNGSKLERGARSEWLVVLGVNEHGEPPTN